jgi:hypothetical protein
MPGSIFIVSQKELDAMMLGMYQKYVSVINNPIDRTSDSSAKFTYYVQTPSDVHMSVGLASDTIFDYSDQNIPAEKPLEITWKFEGNPLNEGVYSARFRFNSLDPTKMQPDYVLSVRVK